MTPDTTPVSTAAPAWSLQPAPPHPRFRLVLGVDVVLGLLGMAVGAGWVVQYSASPSSTAAIGIMVGLLLIALMSVPLLLCAVALALRFRRPGASWFCSLLALTLHASLALTWVVLVLASLL